MRELLSILVMISKINPGEKLIVRNKHISVDNRWFQSILRTWEHESRENTVQRLIDIYSEIRGNVLFLLNGIDNVDIKSSETRLYKHRSIKDIYRLLRYIATALGRSYKGIKNLAATYSDDSNISARLESIMEVDIKDVYTDIAKTLPEDYKPEIILFSDRHMAFSEYHRTSDSDQTNIHISVLAEEDTNQQIRNSE